MTELSLLDRRSLFRLGAVGTLAALTVPALTSCAAPALSSLGATWFQAMTAALVANVAAVPVTSGLQGYWAEWQSGLDRTIAAESEQGFGFHTANCANDGVPPAVVFATSQQDGLDGETDRFIVCVERGEEYVAFEPWAWKALYSFAVDLTDGKDGDTLAGFQALCRISLVPNATLTTSVATESNRSELLTYRTRNGEVEMNRRTNDDGSTTVQVVATGIPSARDSATTREFNVD